MRYRHVLVALTLLGCIGCATTSSVGSRLWHDQRMMEIEAAYENGELSDEAYLELKNQTDQTRVDYQNALRDRAYYYPGPSYYAPFSYPHHHHYRPYYHRPYRR